MLVLVREVWRRDVAIRKLVLLLSLGKVRLARYNTWELFDHERACDCRLDLHFSLVRAHFRYQLILKFLWWLNSAYLSLSKVDPLPACLSLCYKTGQNKKRVLSCGEICWCWRGHLLIFSRFQLWCRQLVNEKMWNWTIWSGDATRVNIERGCNEKRIVMWCHARFPVMRFWEGGYGEGVKNSTEVFWISPYWIWKWTSRLH